MPAIDQDYTQKLAHYVAHLTYGDLPPEVHAQTKKVILDALACAVACSHLENGRLMVQLGQTLSGNPEASVLGGSYRTSVLNAALVNGMLGHGDEIDESLEEVGHASAVMVPTALACGEKLAINGKAMIAAVVAGYDVAARLVNAGLASSRLNKGLSSALVSMLPGTATAANVFQIDENRTHIAFGLAAAQAGGFYNKASESKHGAKSVMRGFVARDAITSVLLARIGYDGPRWVLDGSYNIISSFSGEGFDQRELLKDLGKKFPIMDTCFKLYSAGHPIHAPVDALLRILAREHIDAAQIKSITTRQPKEEHSTVNNRDMPEITITYCMAVAAFDRQLTWDQYAPERVNDPTVLDLKSRVTSLHDPKLDERKKITKAHSAEVDLETRDGRRFTERADYPPGDPGNPLTQEQIEKKAMHYASRVLGERKAERLIDMVNNLEKVTNVNDLGEIVRI